MKQFLVGLFPFVRWFPLTGEKIRYDLIAGITVALILVPQSMAYAQLAGLPVVYGLYASFIPVIIASLWGSSSQLHTGPVAMLSLMSAAALIPFATPGSSQFIELSIMLAFMVGVLRLALGIFKLGSIVNLLSSPVIVGFTNAAALIIGLSQFSKIIGVPFPRTESYLADLWRVLTQIPEMHLLTLVFAIGSWVAIAGLRRIKSTLPGVLIVVVATTLISALVGFENKIAISSDQFHNKHTADLLDTYDSTKTRIDGLIAQVADLRRQAKKYEAQEDINNAAGLSAQADVYDHELSILKAENTVRLINIHGIKFTAARDQNNALVFF